MKKKRYKVMPLICLIMFICFIGCGIVSILSLTLPYGEILVYPLGAIIFGLVFILVGVNDLYSLLRCREKVDGVYCGYNTYYGGNGISTQSPIFEYTYNGTLELSIFVQCLNPQNYAASANGCSRCLL